MSLTKDQVKHVAKLANLPITQQEEELYSDQLSKILDYIEQLDQIDTSNVEPTFNVSGQSNVLDEDKVKTCFTQDEVLSNASQKRDGFFITKGVFDE